MKGMIFANPAPIRLVNGEPKISIDLSISADDGWQGGVVQDFVVGSSTTVLIAQIKDAASTVAAANGRILGQNDWQLFGGPA